MINWPNILRSIPAPAGAMPPARCYGLKPASHGFALADLRCEPDKGANVRGAYSEHAIAFLLDGAFDYACPQQKGTVVPGALLFANKGQEFRCSHLGPVHNRRIALFLSDDFLEPIAEDLQLDTLAFRAALMAPAKTGTRIGGLLYALAQHATDPGERAELALHIAGMALQHNDAKDGDRATSARDRARILAALHHVDATFREACSLDDLAAAADMSRYRFARLFRAVTGETPCQYIVNRRLEAAARQLVETDAAVTDVAFDSGFNDLSYFHNRFRATYGCTPRHWRHGRRH